MALDSRLVSTATGKGDNFLSIPSGQEKKSHPGSVGLYQAKFSSFMTGGLQSWAPGAGV
jgi:hypothetical protein